MAFHLPILPFYSNGDPTDTLPRSENFCTALTVDFFFISSSNWLSAWCPFQKVDSSHDSTSWPDKVAAARSTAGHVQPHQGATSTTSILIWSLKSQPLYLVGPVVRYPLLLLGPHHSISAAESIFSRRINYAALGNIRFCPTSAVKTYFFPIDMAE